VSRATKPLKKKKNRHPLTSLLDPQLHQHHHFSVEQERKSTQQPEKQYEEHPRQFICSIATQHITHYLFETATEKDKAQWCEHLGTALKAHVQR
jgi:hypothetical protein